MDLKAMERNWDSVVDRLVEIFPQTERDTVEKFSGRISAFVEYVAKAHDLTRLEAIATLEERVALPLDALNEVQTHRMAAE